MAELTGAKVFAITATAFGVIIGVNIFMAVMAVGTFPGLEVRNSYVASQSFDADRAAQEALGWKLDTTYADGTLQLRFRDANGHPAQVADVTATIGRTTVASEDITVEFRLVLDTFEAPVVLGPGRWMILLDAHSADGTSFRQRVNLFVKGQ